jgi:ATP-dependent protease ClpP protease subunit
MSYRLFSFDGGITNEPIEDCARWIQRWTKDPSIDSLVIDINSDGGWAHATFYLLRQIHIACRSRNIKFVTVARQVSSAAALLFLSGHERLIEPGGVVFLHGVDLTIPVWAISDDGRIPPDDLKSCKRLQLDAEKWIASRTRLHGDDLHRIMRTKEGRVFNARDALDSGIATRIASREEIISGLDRPSDSI